jgi:hypothetical protein
MEIIQKPDSLSLLGNLKKFLISSNAEVDFSLSVSIDGADVSLLQESYTPDSSGNISIDVREVCGQYLKTNLPSDNVFLQSDALRTFTATIGSSSWSFTVVNASVRNLTLSALEYLQYNFLTLQPQSKQVSWHSPEYLTYYFTEQADVQAKFYLKSGGTETVTVATISPTPEGGSGTIQLVNKVYTINTSLSRLMALSSHDTEDLQGIVDVWVQGSVSRLSYIQRYVYAPSTGEEHHYFAVNSLGGIDTFTFIGEQKITGEIEHQAAENDDKKITVTSGGQRKYRQNTGYLGEASSEWLWEFLHSSRQWVVAAAAAEEIVVVSSSLSQGDLTNLNSSSFDFLLARDGGLLPESRRDETFPDITVPSPVSDLFFLNPRIIDFPAAPSDAELVFPVQSLYSNEWSYLTLQELQERLSIAASLNHTHRNLSVLQDLGDSNGQLTYRGAVVGSGGGISLPIAISDVEGLSTALNNKANISHSHSWNDITDKPHFVDFTSEQTITGLKHMHHLDILLSMAIPQAAPEDPEAGKIYFWLDENGNSASAPYGGSVANVYPLTITKNNVSWLVYNPGTQAETVDLEIPTKVSQLQNDSGYLTQHQSLAGYATQSWVQQQGYLTSHQSLSGYATESWVGTQIDALNLDSVLAGIASNSARISTLEDRVKIDMPYRLSDLQNDLSLDDLPDGNSRKLANYLPLAGGTMTGAISSMDIKPKTTATYDLGTASLRWADLYVTAIKWHTSDADSLQFYSNSGTHYAKLTTDTFRLDCNVRPASGHSLGQANYPWDTIVGNTIQARTALNALGTLSVSGAATFSSGLTSEGDVLISASSAYLKFSAQDAGLYWETQVNSQTMYRPFLSIDDHDCITIGNGDLADITFANDAYAGYLEADFLYSNGPVYAEGNITTESTLEAQGGFVPPTAAPANPVAGKVYFWIDLTGNSVNS